MEIKLVGLRLKDAKGRLLTSGEVTFDYDVKALIAKLQKQRQKPSNWQGLFKNQMVTAVPPGIWHHNYQRLQQNNIELYFLLKDREELIDYQAFIEAADADIETIDRMQTVTIHVPLLVYQPRNMARLQFVQHNFQRPAAQPKQAPQKQLPFVDPFIDLENRLEQLNDDLSEDEESEGNTEAAHRSMLSGS